MFVPTCHTLMLSPSWSLPIWHLLSLLWRSWSTLHLCCCCCSHHWHDIFVVVMITLPLHGHYRYDIFRYCHCHSQHDILNTYHCLGLREHISSLLLSWQSSTCHTFLYHQHDKPIIVMVIVNTQNELHYRHDISFFVIWSPSTHHTYHCHDHHCWGHLCHDVHTWHPHHHVVVTDGQMMVTGAVCRLDVLI